MLLDLLYSEDIDIKDLEKMIPPFHHCAVLL